MRSYKSLFPAVDATCTFEPTTSLDDLNGYKTRINNKEVARRLWTLRGAVK